MNLRACIFPALFLLGLLWRPTLGQDSIDFNRDIRPLLSDRCFLCHGTDQASEEAQSTSLRLDSRDAAVEGGVLDLDDAASSEILLRIRSTDPDLQMPPPNSGKASLTANQADQIEKWIREGAVYQEHWAWSAPVRPQLPPAKEANLHPIDRLVRQQLPPGLVPAPEANRETLIRRLALDLTGLPPTPEETLAYVSDPRDPEVAWEAQVDHFLASPAYGEQMAKHWLDAARYADTSGYQYDRERTQWVWRDWVIDAFNQNLPFDEFTVQQLAGDLLPEATPETILATGFNRNHPITIEGGVVDEEYRTEYVMDRVVTTSTVWMGQTFLCARCHDHKYDPWTQQDFYQFYAFFNQVPEKGLNGFDPQQVIPSPLKSSQLAALKTELEQCQSQVDQLNIDWGPWLETYRKPLLIWNRIEEANVSSMGDATLSAQPDGSWLASGKNPDRDDYLIEFTTTAPVSAFQLEAFTDESLTAGSASRGSNGNFVLTEFAVTGDEKTPLTFDVAVADYQQSGFGVGLAIDGKLDRKGWAVDGNTRPENRTAIFVLKEPVPKGTKLQVRMSHRYGLSHQIGRFRLTTSSTVTNASQAELAVADPPAKLPPALQVELVKQFGNLEAIDRVERLQQKRKAWTAANQFPPTLVMRDREELRPTYILERGEYNRPRTDLELDPSVPEKLLPWNPDWPRNRLGLARWLVSPQHPLTARVTVNRLWQQLFGLGLVKTPEDFGFQGVYPSHPQLLDWLACEFVESGWDVKSLFKTIMMSRTYRQASSMTAATVEQDPLNRWLARGPRYRLDAETIRDQALSVSGLLDQEVGGPSVYPYHPEGLWLEINNRPNFSRAYPHTREVRQHYRRSLYTFWKRTLPPPSMAAFDAPGRETCTVQRSRTNTPLQAFVLLHDPQFVEAARQIAAWSIQQAEDTEQQIRQLFRRCLNRSPSKAELQVLQQQWIAAEKRFAQHPQQAEQLLQIGLRPADPKLDPRTLAAMTEVARLVMNLSEFVTKP